MVDEKKTGIERVKKAFNEIREWIISNACGDKAKDKINKLQNALEEYKEEPIVQEMLDLIPAFNQILPIIRTGLLIKDRFYFKKIMKFVQSIQNGTISEEEIELHRKEFENSNSDKEIETILLVLERFNDELKAEYLGKFYLTFLKGLIVWDEFCELAEVTDRMIMVDYKVLMKIYEEGPETDINNVNYKYDRLVSLGLFEDLQRAGGIFLDNEEDNKFVGLTDLGRTYCDIICNKNDSLKTRKSSNRDFTGISMLRNDDIDNIIRQ